MSKFTWEPRVYHKPPYDTDGGPSVQYLVTCEIDGQTYRRDLHLHVRSTPEAILIHIGAAFKEMGLMAAHNTDHCPECLRGEYFLDMDRKHLCCCWHWRDKDFLSGREIPGPHLKPGETRPGVYRYDLPA